VDFIL